MAEPQDHDLNNLDHNDFINNYGYNFTVDPPSVPIKDIDPNPDANTIPGSDDVPGAPPPSGNPDCPDS